jgi:hypothetical protein
MISDLKVNNSKNIEFNEMMRERILKIKADIRKKENETYDITKEIEDLSYKKDEGNIEKNELWKRLKILLGRISEIEFNNKKVRKIY